MGNTCNFLVLSSLLVTTYCRPESGYQYPQQQQPLHHNTGPLFPVQQQPLQHNTGPSLQQTFPVQQNLNNYLPPHSAPGLDFAQSYQNQHGQFQRGPQGGFNPIQPGSLNLGNTGLNSGFPQVHLPQFPADNQHLQVPQVQFPGFNPQPQVNFNNFPQNLQLPNNLGQPQGPVVTKHVYVHIAPEEPQAAPQSAPLPLAPQKHYKIIFIKAPSQQTAQRQVIHAPAVQQPVEEKTLIYVLVNKAKQPEIVVPPPAPTQPSKPEVYFIKYKANNGAGSGPSSAGLPIVEDVKKNGQPENSGESSSSLFSGALPGQAGLSSKYGPPGYSKRSA